MYRHKYKYEYIYIFIYIYIYIHIYIHICIEQSERGIISKNITDIIFNMIICISYHI